MNPDPRTIGDVLLRRNAENSARLDACPENILNCILWHAVRGSGAPYPAWAVSAEREDGKKGAPTR
ncbi:MAG TPA: hypothetical protein PKI53_00910 [Candidatus Aminicenantes bacterium]|nr:hypothetical protein [Acidobacteriota bacterium]HNQ79640.1 hypothetical protein [Candidatus Aminicenantes bacterium]HPH43654.1 hypothetical protein [Candidatus Aminicenantes bacterium]